MAYDLKSSKAEEFINDELIVKTLAEAKEKAKDKAYIESLIAKAGEFKGLEAPEVAALSYVEDKELLDKMYKTAETIKNHIYGKRVVIFAPLYISDYCINGCTYCGYSHKHKIKRSRLTDEQLREEVEVLESMGHKRLALEYGEAPVHCDIDYILNSIKVIYDVKKAHGEIRRVNVNIAATTVENYKKLKDVGIGTYILFQETYHKPTYEKLHLYGPKSNYEWHTTAHDRAMQAGIDDVGFGALYGLYDWHYDLLGTFFHAAHMEAVFGVGPHTISVPRIKPAIGTAMQDFPYAVPDEDFKKLVAIIRMAVPYTGIIMSTRESQEMRKACLNLGVSQISAGSCTGVGGYSALAKGNTEGQVVQFKISDERTPMEILKELLKDGFIPSFCTACYRAGRTGDRFMAMAKDGSISNCCQPNAMVTLKEYAMDYGDDEFKQMADKVINDNLDKITNPKVREKAVEYLAKIEEGERDFRW